jgi:hypothetical protein
LGPEENPTTPEEHIMKLRPKVLALALSIVGASTAFADTVVLNFEGINTPYPTENYASIENFYNGGTSSVGTSGPNYGITFSSNALAICLNTPGEVCSNTSRGGLGDPNSQEGGLFFLSGSNTFLDDAGGFTTGFSLFYSAISEPGSLSVYSGLDGTGTLLGTLALPTTPSNCPGTYDAGFCPFVPVGVSFSGTAESISFAGVADQIVFDDVTFGSATPGTPTPEPSTLVMLLTGAGAGVGVLRRRLMRSQA